MPGFPHFALPLLLSTEIFSSFTTPRIFGIVGSESLLYDQFFTQGSFHYYVPLLFSPALLSLPFPLVKSLVNWATARITNKIRLLHAMAIWSSD